MSAEPESTNTQIGRELLGLARKVLDNNEYVPSEDEQQLMDERYIDFRFFKDVISISQEVQRGQPEMVDPAAALLIVAAYNMQQRTFLEQQEDSESGSSVSDCDEENEKEDSGK